MLPSSLWTAENVTVIKSYSSAFFFPPFFSTVNRAKESHGCPVWHTPFSAGCHPAQDQIALELHGYSQIFFLSWISGGPWDKSSHEVVEVYPVCALCQPPWGWASCDLPLWLLKTSYGRKNVLPHTWWEGNIGFAGWAYQYGFHVWNYGIFFFQQVSNFYLLRLYTYLYMYECMH